MLRWVGLLMAVGGGLTAIIAGKGEDWFTAIIGGLIFIIGMAALTNRGSGQWSWSGVEGYPQFQSH